jgi:hypothetical protein
MTDMKTYKEQSAEINRLSDRIKLKCANLAQQTKNSYYGDLLHVIEDLKEIDLFINDKYLTHELPKE